MECRNPPASEGQHPSNPPCPVAPQPTKLTLAPPSLGINRTTPTPPPLADSSAATSWRTCTSSASTIARVTTPTTTWTLPCDAYRSCNRVAWYQPTTASSITPPQTTPRFCFRTLLTGGLWRRKGCRKSGCLPAAPSCLGRWTRRLLDWSAT